MNDITAITSLRFGEKLRYDGERLSFGEASDAPEAVLYTSPSANDSRYADFSPGELDLVTLQTLYSLFIRYMSAPWNRDCWLAIEPGRVPSVAMKLDVVLDRLDYIPSAIEDGIRYVKRITVPYNNIFGNVNCRRFTLLSITCVEDGMVRLSSPLIAALVLNARRLDRKPRDPAIVLSTDLRIRFGGGNISFSNSCQSVPLSLDGDSNYIGSFPTKELQAYYSLIQSEAARPEVLEDLHINTVFHISGTQLLEAVGLGKKSTLSRRDGLRRIPGLVNKFERYSCSFKTGGPSLQLLRYEGYDSATGMVALAAPCLVDRILDCLERLS